MSPSKKEKQMSPQSTVDKVFGWADTLTKKLGIIVGLLTAIIALVLKLNEAENTLLPKDTQPYTQLLLDISDNMNHAWIPNKQKQRWQSANEIIASIAPHYDGEDEKLSLRTFGGDCGNLQSSLLVPFANHTSDSVISAAVNIERGGDANLVAALRGAIGDFKNNNRSRSPDLRNELIVIMGGTLCPEEPIVMEKLKKDLKEFNIDLAFRLIAMGDDANIEAIEAVRLTLGGKLYITENEEELYAATQKNPPPSGPMNWTKAIRNFDAQNDRKALDFFKTVANQGSDSLAVESAFHLGLVYSDRTSEFCNIAQSIEYFNKAWEMGRHLDSAFLAGVILEEGRTCPGQKKNAPDSVTALEWYRVGKDEGHEPAKAAFQRLTDKLQARK